jgi:hypothetical protein
MFASSFRRPSGFACRARGTSQAGLPAASQTVRAARGRLGNVDLRWGVSDEESAEDHALPICLTEIERCWPYFIGLLRERYGAAVDKVHPDVLAREPWLKDYLDHSLTELEILYRVSRRPGPSETLFLLFPSSGLFGPPASGR